MWVLFPSIWVGKSICCIRFLHKYDHVILINGRYQLLNSWINSDIDDDGGIYTSIM